MRVEIHQGRITCKIVICGIHTKVGIGDGRMRHVKRVNDLLKVGGRTIGGDVVGENDEDLDGGRKAKRTAYLTKRINKSPDQQSGHMNIKQRSETDLEPMIIKRLIGNRSKNDHRTTDRKPI